MKKLLIILFVFLLVGCNTNNSKSGEMPNPSDEFETKKKIVCDEIADSKLISYDLFVTNDGRLFRYSTDQLFSGDVNCKEVEKQYDFGWSGKVKVGDFVGLDQGGLIDTEMNQIFYENNKLKIMGNYSYALKGVKEWYFGREIIKRENDKLFVYDYVDEIKAVWIPVEGTISASAKIERVNGNVMMIDSKYYLLQKVADNKEECEKYADIECNYVYKLSEFNYLNKIKDEIFNAYMYIDGDYPEDSILVIITKDYYVKNVLASNAFANQ